MTVHVSTDPTIETLASRSQHSFSTLWDGYPSNEAAKDARDAAYKLLKKAGITANRWVLKNQLREWASFGIPDGRMCDVYMLNVRR
jgi:hypothetical protein